MRYSYEELAGMIDHSLLHPTMTDRELEEGCRVAAHYRVASVCIKPYYARRAAEILAGSSVAICTVIGFPHGGSVIESKRYETERACRDGATEIDMVINIGKALSGDWDYVATDIRAVVEEAHRHGAIVKVIFENDFIPDDAIKIRLCQVCEAAQADYVKTSTGYGSGGATLEDLALMRKHAAPHLGVKAAGGVRDLDALLKVRALGVTRCSATRTADMLEEARRRLGLEPIRAVGGETQTAGY